MLTGGVNMAYLSRSSIRHL